MPRQTFVQLILKVGDLIVSSISYEIEDRSGGLGKVSTCTRPSKA